MRGLGFRVWGLGFRVWGLGSGVDGCSKKDFGSFWCLGETPPLGKFLVLRRE